MPKPIIDPAAEDKTKQTPSPEQTVVLNKDEFDKLMTRVAVVEDRTSRPTPAANPTPAPASVPTFDEQLKPINDKVNELNTAINDKLSKGEPLGDLLTQRDALVEKRMSLRFQHEHLDPVRQAGVSSLTQISKQLAKGNMPYYDLLKDQIEATLATLPKEQLASPDTYKQVHDFVAGQNMDKILEQEREKILRKAQEEPGGLTPGQPGRQTKQDPDAPPPIEQLYSAETLRMLRQNDRTIDDHYRTLGYEGYEDWWKQTGKAHHQGKE